MLKLLIGLSTGTGLFALGYYCGKKDGYLKGIEEGNRCLDKAREDGYLKGMEEGDRCLAKAHKFLVETCTLLNVDPEMVKTKIIVDEVQADNIVMFKR